jgi:hypothetical protein
MERNDGIEQGSAESASEQQRLGSAKKGATGEPDKGRKSLVHEYGQAWRLPDMHAGTSGYSLN